MSLSFQPLQPVEVMDPILMLSNQRFYSVLRGGSQYTYKAWTTTSVAQSALNFSAPPPSVNTAVSRVCYLYLPMRLSFTGIPMNNQTLLQAGYDAPRQFPLQACLDTISCCINNQSFSINSADIIHALMKYNTGTLLKNGQYSMTPSYPDQSCEYEAMIYDTRSPLGFYGDGTEGGVTPRGGFPFKIIANPVGDGSTQMTAIVDLAVCEPIELSPFSWGLQRESGFYGVTNFDWSFTFIQTMASRIWSHAIDPVNGSAFTSTNVIFGSMPNGPTSFSNYAGNQPYLLFEYVTPQEIQQIPKEITYPYSQVIRFPTDLGLVQPNVSQQATSNNIQLNNIPRRIYLYVRESNQSLYSNSNSTDSFCSIQNVSIQFQNKNGLLASANMLQLYEICRDNGCNLNWQQWSGSMVYTTNDFSSQYGTIGGVICLNLAHNIGLDSLTAPGKLANTQIQLTCQIKNNSAVAKLMTMYIVTVAEGSLCINEGKCFANIGVLSSADILEAQNRPRISYNQVQDVSGSGNYLTGQGDLGQDILHGLKNVHDWFKENKVLSRVLGAFPVTQPFGKLAKHFGYGGEGVENMEMECRPPLYQDYGEGVVIGGKRMTRKKLKSSMHARVY